MVILQFPTVYFEQIEELLSEIHTAEPLLPKPSSF